MSGIGQNEATPYNSPTFGNPLSLRVDTGVGAMTISPSGRDIALASRSGLFIVDLDDPFSPPRWLHHRTSWEVADVQWSPHTSKPYWVISTSNQKALVWNLALASEKAVEHVLHGHHRAITDINFHSGEPEIIATCSVDSYVHAWDLRVPKSPIQSFADWRAGATQVKWNRRDPNILASSHDRAVYIWDRRKGAIPLHKIESHERKVNGIDFSRTCTSKILTSSNDKTVKEWDYSLSTTHPEMTIVTDFPVWRARHTPFGAGCLIMPYLGGDNSLYLHRLEQDEHISEQRMEPTKVFKGHSEPVREFVWRYRGGQGETEDRDFQLITWSKDHDLRLWPVDSTILRSVGFIRGTKLNMPITRRGAKYETYRKEPEHVDSASGATYSKDLPSNPHAVAFGVSPSGYHPRRNGSFVKGRAAGGFMTGGYPRAYSIDQSDSAHHLDWIAGVRFGRSALSFTPTVFDNTTQSGAFTVPLPSSTNPSNFGEEVSLVGHKFPKLRFEKISVSTGECVITLHGPWGSVPEDGTEHELVFMRLSVQVPVDYPFGAPTFSIEEDNKLSAETIKELLTKMNSIATRLTEHGVYCLEPCLRYLMGDNVSEQDYLDEHGKLNNVESEVIEIPLFDGDSSAGMDYLTSSGDDESDDDPDFMRLQPQATFDSTPMPRGCGAVWGTNGELVCFFQCKKDKIPRRLPSPKPTEKDFGDDDSEGSHSDSDSFESDSDDFARADYLQLPGRRRTNFTNFKTSLRLRQFGYGAASGPLSTAGSAAHDQINIIKICDFKNLIASRRDLAAEYRIMGASPWELCRINGQVAEKYGCWDVAYCWNLLYRIICGAAPAMGSISPQKAQGHPGHLNSAFSHIGTLAATNSALLGQYSSKVVSGQLGLFEWRSHPFGRQWLIDELFEYFEKQNNTQMLANMSCVLAPVLHSNYDAHPRQGPAKVSSMFFKSPGTNDANTPEATSYFNLGHHGGKQFAGKPSLDSPVQPFPLSYVSSNESEYSSPIRPPFGAFASQRGSTAVSSENASAVATANNSFRSNSFLPFMRASESETDMTNHLLLSDAGVLSAPVNRIRSKAMVAKGSGHHALAGHSGISAGGIRNEIINRDLYFGGEDLMEDISPRVSEPLLNPKKADSYAAYRDQYATLLYLWGLEIERLEVLKFNYVGRTHVASTTAGSGTSPFDEFHTTQIQFRSRRPLDDPEIIRPKEIVLNRIYSRSCQYCRLIIRSRFSQCPNCEHITHSECGEQWWMVDGGTECVSGCGCNCLAYL